MPIEPAVGSWQVLLMLLLGGGFGTPTGIPPEKEDPAMARVAPAQCLFYSSWAGTAATDPETRNHTERLLREPDVQRFVAGVADGFQAAAATANATEPQPPALEQTLARLLQLVRPRAGVVYLTDVQIRPQAPPQLRAGALFQVGDQAATIREQLQTVQDRLREVMQVASVRVQGHEFTQWQFPDQAPTVTWGFFESYLLLVIGEETAADMLQRIGGEPPAWLRDVRARLPIPRPVGVTYVNVRRLVDLVARHSGQPEAARKLSALGLDKLDWLACVGGLDDTGYVSRTRLTISGKPAGLWAWLDQPPLTAEDLHAIPAGSPVAIVARLDVGGLLNTWLSAVQTTDPDEAQELAANLQELEQELGLSVREDLLKSLSDPVRIYANPDAGGLLTGWTATIGIRDRQRLAQVEDRLLTLLQKLLADGNLGASSHRTRRAGEHTIHSLRFPGGDIPFAPSWCVGKDTLYFALMPQAIEACLARESGQRSLADEPDVARVFQGRARNLGLMYVDMRQVVQTLLPLAQLWLTMDGEELPDLPPLHVLLRHLQPLVAVAQRTPDGIEVVTQETLPTANLAVSAPVSLALGWPAIQSIRESGRREASVSNLQQIVLALHNYHDTYGAFPPAYTTDEKGRPLLSWRVQILPFLEQAGLYQQFRQDEPWDSEHNQALIARMPDVFRHPNSKAEAGRTSYLGVAGADGIFAPPKEPQQKGIGIAAITDGTSNTAALVEVPDELAVPWTKPADFVPDEKQPGKPLRGTWRGGFQAALADGSVRFIADTVDPQMLRFLFQKSDGHNVQLPEPAPPPMLVPVLR